MNWTIIGCGWLGTSLGEKLVQKGEPVIGTTTSLSRRQVLIQNGIKHVIFNINSQISTDIIDYSKIVVLSIPPFERNNPLKYGESLVHLCKQFKPSTHFIFLGSTGIYPQKEGLFKEDYHFENSEKNISLYQAEKQLSNFLKSRLTILRLGGLFGNDRHPIYSVSGKTEVKNPEGKINFAGKSDIISVIEIIAERHLFGEIFNVVYPSHPNRKEYYTQKAEELNLAPPKFDNSLSIVREISSDKIQNKLDFVFKQTI
jgi:nucleoside-diphosphate-sugar epimerase